MLAHIDPSAAVIGFAAGFAVALYWIARTLVVINKGKK